MNHQSVRGALFHNTRAILVFSSAFLVACSSVFEDCSCISVLGSLCPPGVFFTKCDRRQHRESGRAPSHPNVKVSKSAQALFSLGKTKGHIISFA